MSEHGYRSSVSELHQYSSNINDSNSYLKHNRKNELIQSVNMSSVQETEKNSMVRKLPKKRKFDLSELEDIEAIKPSNQATISEVNSHAIGLQQSTTQNKSPTNHQSQVYPLESMHVQQSVITVQPPPQSVAVDYSFREVSDCSVNTQPVHSKYVDVLSSRFPPLEEMQMQNRSCEQDIVKSSLAISNANILTSPSKKSIYLNSSYSGDDIFIDLNEWKEHRVLAKHNNIYIPGVIRQAGGAGEVWVELDYCEGKPVKYSNVFRENKFDIISDASPSKGQLMVGSRIVVRKEMNKDQMNSSVFVEGVICNILNCPMRFVVTISGNEELTVKRADLRLLQPPWWDELADLDNSNSNVNVMMPGQSYAEESQYNNMMQCGLMITDNNVPLQLNQVVPTLQTGNDYYRTTATSPLHLITPVSHNSTCTPLSNGSADDLRPRHYDDFCESDDELRREDIMFPMDAGRYFKEYYSMCMFKLTCLLD